MAWISLHFQAACCLSPSQSCLWSVGHRHVTRALRVIASEHPTFCKDCSARRRRVSHCLLCRDDLTVPVNHSSMISHKASWLLPLGSPSASSPSSPSGLYQRQASLLSLCRAAALPPGSLGPTYHSGPWVGWTPRRLIHVSLQKRQQQRVFLLIIMPYSYKLALPRSCMASSDLWDFYSCPSQSSLLHAPLECICHPVRDGHSLFFSGRQLGHSMMKCCVRALV